MTATIRLATDGDAPTVAAIYAPYCESSPVSFETTAPSAEEMAQRIRSITAEWPWLVLDTGVYATLLDILRQQGYVKACAGITMPNLASVGLHEAVGFKQVGVYRGIGYKLGTWHDVAWYEAEVQPESASPSSPQPVSVLLRSVGWQEATERGLTHYVEQR